MTRRRIMLTVVAAALVLLAVYAVKRESSRGIGNTGASVSPGLSARLDEVARIEVRRGKDSVELVRDGAEWKLESSDGFPAKPGAVRSLLLGLADLKVVEPMTELPARHKELDLAWPDESGAAQLVRLFGADGSPICEVLLGKSLTAARTQAVRLPGTNECLKVAPAVYAEVAASGYFDYEGLALPKPNFDRIAFDGLVLSKATAPSGEAANGSADRPVWSVTGTEPVVWSEKQLRLAQSSLPTFLDRLDPTDARSTELHAGEGCESDRVIEFSGPDALVEVSIRTVGEKSWFSLRISAPPGSPLSDEWQRIAARTKRWDLLLPGWKARQLTDMRVDPVPAASTDADSGGTIIPPSH